MAMMVNSIALPEKRSASLRNRDLRSDGGSR
jgi:hypothetical protein